MKHNMKRILRFTQDRTFWVRAVRAWRELLPDWTPTLDEQASLELMPWEHRAAVAVLSDGWEPNDARWDVLMALLEWERRQERMRLQAADELSRMAQEMDEMDRRWPVALGDIEPAATVIPLKVVKGSEVVSESETTVETPLKAFFLDRVVHVKHLSERSEG